VEEINELPEFRDVPHLSLRVGIATGKVVVGDCGAPPALNDYTVIGNAVNLAARLESANKQFGTRILINERTREELEGQLLVRWIGKVRVVGQKSAVQVYEVLEEDAPREMIELTERAAGAFARGDFAGCLAAWDEFSRRFGPSKLIDVYREAIVEARAAGGEFDGVLRLREK
jgi:adenylate cyclase